MKNTIIEKQTKSENKVDLPILERISDEHEQIINEFGVVMNDLSNDDRVLLFRNLRKTVYSHYYL